ncbi:methylated-DNA-[protein]-cysteine S-methyltransferase [Methylomarinovum tepidoasis]|uniref:Methylated-DNA-[protein]-cysteine S-methyltransferase n=1 Tax=Methylomarinovum tepidoasis TaxID=2840183 RepID=A0AAU9BWN2_9GAMM|nr:methylated-DNA-[protein]-cysteine S-methyltransferase [Methylomarinovum sp. IN45]
MTGLSWRLQADFRERNVDATSVHRVLRALRYYFEIDPTCGFDFPLRLTGTPFQHRVWGALLGIPAGQVRTYGTLAAQLQTSPRAVAAACRANPCPVAVPCHRVVAATGLGGYCGATRGPRLEIKKWLLAHEGWHG